MNNMYSQMSNLSVTINNVEYGIRRELEDVMEAEQNYVADLDYKYEHLNEDEKNMFTVFTIDLKEKQASSELYLVAKTEGGEILRTVLTQDEGLTYVGGMTLGLDDVYQVNVEEELDGSLKQLNYYSYEVPLYYDFYERRIEEKGGSAGADNKSMYVTKNFSVNSYGIEDLEVDKVDFVISLKGEKVYEEDVTDELFDMYELTEDQRLQAVSGELIIDRPESFGSASNSEISVSEAVYDDECKGSSEVLVNESELTHYIFQKVLVYDEVNVEGLSDNFENMDKYLLLQFKDGTERKVWF
mgnify:CR=1 FL=1